MSVCALSHAATRSGSCWLRAYSSVPSIPHPPVYSDHALSSFPFHSLCFLSCFSVGVSYNVCTSLTSPASPYDNVFVTENILLNSVPIVSPCAPNRLSDAMATQSFPTIATRAPPLYCIIDMMGECGLGVYVRKLGRG